MNRLMPGLAAVENIHPFFLHFPVALWPTGGGLPCPRGPAWPPGRPQAGRWIADAGSVGSDDSRGFGSGNSGGFPPAIHPLGSPVDGGQRPRLVEYYSTECGLFYGSGGPHPAKSRPNPSRPSSVLARALREQETEVLVIRTIQLTIAAVVWLAAPAPATATDDPEVLAALAVERQPAVDVLRERVHALRATASVAGVWSDPTIGFEFSNLPVTAPLLDQHPMAGLQFKLQQQLPSPGQSRARVHAARARVDAGEAEIATLETALRGEVRGRYWDLALVRQLRRLTERHVAELDGMIGAVSARYEVGAASQHDLLQLQLRRDRLWEMLPDLDARAQVVQAALNGALARDPGTVISTPDATEVLPLPADLEARADALVRHPELVQLKVQAAALRAEAAQARVEISPDPTIWLGYRIRTAQSNGDPGTNFVTAGVSVPIPAASSRRWEAGAEAAEARARASEEAASARGVRLSAQLASAEARYRRAVERSRAYRSVLETAARTALESTVSAYQVDRAGFADLIRAEIDLLDVQGERLRSDAEAAGARAEILTLIGDPVAGGAP